MGMTDETIQKAVYQYNGLGHRMGQNIATGGAAPAQTRPDLFLGWQCCRNERGKKCDNSSRHNRINSINIIYKDEIWYIWIL